jgi:hypothetical protein
VTFPSPEPPPAEPPADGYTRPWEPLGYRGPAAYPTVLDYPLERRRRRWWMPLVGLGVAFVVLWLGVPLGMLWNALAPHIPAIQTDQGAIYADPEGEQPVGAEGTFVFLMLGAGIVLAILAWLLLRRVRGVEVLLGLALGAAIAGGVAARVGHALGHRSAPVGAHFDAAVRLRAGYVAFWHGWLPYARGDVLFLALAAVLTYVVLAGFSAYPSLRRPTPQEVQAEQLRAAESVRAVGDGQLGQGYGYRPDPAQESDLPAQ